MKKPPFLELMPRVAEDIDGCIEFIARQPWGKPQERKQDIFRGIADICRAPLGNAIKVRRPSTGRELRRHSVAQFAIVYTYDEPSPKFPHGRVSIRAVRHRRLKNVFSGVREPELPWYGDMAG